MRWKPCPEARRHEYVFGRESVGPRAGGLFLTISNPSTASAFGDAGFGELDLSAQWRIYSCFGRASLADLDPPGFLSRAYSYATAIPIGATSTATPAPARGMGIYRTLPADGYDRDDRDGTGRDCGHRRRSAHARRMDAQSIVAAGDHANRALSMRGFRGGLSPRREPQKRQATLRRSATVSPSGSMSTDSSRVMARSR